MARKSNCLLVALWLCWKHPDSYLIIRKSNYGLFPHFLWARRLPPDMRLIQYTTDTKPRFALTFHGKFYRRERAKPPSNE